jgi:LuxR family transcriptional regulator, maltose regulon positive regulatory protein
VIRLSLRGQHDVAGFVAAFTGSHRYVLDYLAEEVLERQSEQVRTFLLETSVLARLSGALSDAVTGRAGNQPQTTWPNGLGLTHPVGAERERVSATAGPAR